METLNPKPILNDREEHLNMVMGTGSLNAVGPTCIDPASITQRSNTGTPGSTRLQALVIGACVHPGYSYSITVYSITLTVVAVAGDTEATIRQKLATKVAGTTAAQWNARGSAPKPGTPGFPPTGIVGLDHLKLILNYQNQFSFSASGTAPKPAPIVVTPLPPAKVISPSLPAPSPAPSITPAPIPPAVILPPPVISSPKIISAPASTPAITPGVIPSLTPTAPVAPIVPGVIPALTPTAPIAPIASGVIPALTSPKPTTPSSSPASSPAPASAPEEIKPQTVINAIFPPATMPYGVSLGRGGGGGGGGGMMGSMASASPEEVALYKKARNYFWITVGLVAASALIFYNKSVNIAGGKV